MQRDLDPRAALTKGSGASPPRPPSLGALHLGAVALLLASPLFAGCGDAAADASGRPFSFSVRVTSDDRAPIVGADVSITGAPPVRTGPTGEVVVDVLGRDGERRAFTVRCPQEYQSPSAPGAVALHVLGDPSLRPRYDVTCPRLKRVVVVAIRARNGANLPVRYLGQEIARTDASGAANALLRLAPGESIRLTLETTAQDGLRPQNPVTQLTVGDTDDLLVFDQTFTVAEKKIPVVRAPAVQRPRRL